VWKLGGTNCRLQYKTLPDGVSGLERKQIWWVATQVRCVDNEGEGFKELAVDPSGQRGRL